MSEIAGLLAVTAAWILLLGAIGSGPAVLLASRYPAALLATPLGLGLAGIGRVEVTLAASSGALAVSSGGTVLTPRPLDRTWCTTVRLGQGTTRLSVTPLTDRPTAPLAEIWQSDTDRVEGLLPPTQLPGLALTRIAASWGAC